MSSGTPKCQTLLKRASAVSSTVGRHLSRISLQAFENWSTITRMLVKLLEAGTSVAKLIPRWDQGWRGIGRGTSLRMGSGSSGAGSFERIWDNASALVFLCPGW